MAITVIVSALVTISYFDWRRSEAHDPDRKLSGPPIVRFVKHTALSILFALPSAFF